MLEPLRLCSGAAAGARLHPNTDNVCVTREEKLIAVVACCTSFFMFLVSASANIGLKKGNKKPSFSIIIPKLAYSPVTRIFFVNKIYPLLFTFLWIDDMTWEDRHHLYFFGT